MTTRTILFLIIVPILYTSCKEESETVWPQLLVNSTIEEGTSQPNGWLFDQQDGTGLEFIWTDEEFSSASKSLQITKASDEADLWGYWTQLYDRDIPYGKDVELSVKIKGKDLQGQGVSIAIRADRQGQPTSTQFATTQGNTEIKGTFDWTTYRIRLSDLESDVYQVYVFLVYTSATTGEVYFDDVTLVVE